MVDDSQQLDTLFSRLSANPRFRSLFAAWLINRADAEDSVALFEFCEQWVDSYISLDTNMELAFEQLYRSTK